MSNGVISQTIRTATPRGDVRKQAQPKGKGLKREARDKPDQTLLPVAEAVARLALEECAKQLAVHATLWTHPEQGYKKVVRLQLTRVVLNNDLIDRRRFRNAKKQAELAELVADLIVTERLMKAVRCIGDKSKVVFQLTLDGSAFLEGTTLREIHEERAARASARDKQTAAAIKMGFRA